MDENFVFAIYDALLGRPPENKNVVEEMLLSKSMTELISNVLNSSEYQNKACLRQFVDNCVKEQMAPWLGKNFPSSDFIDALNFDQSESLSLYKYSIKNNIVSFVEKNNAIPVFRDRACNYKDMIQSSINTFPISIEISFGIDVNDEAEERVNYPIMSFQKRAGECNILLPDFELHMLDYTSKFPVDSILPDKKICKAIFAGSTTGKTQININDVIDRSTPRLKAAYYFKDIPSVDFYLPSLVQCTADAEALLRQDGFGINSTTWEEAFKSKFIISIDGNGATCSRPLIIMNSNSLMLKYNSSYILYWTSQAIPWIHYVPIENELDIVDIIKTCKSTVDRYDYISIESNKFVNMFFNKRAVEFYVHKLLTHYATLISG